MIRAIQKAPKQQVVIHWTLTGTVTSYICKNRHCTTCKDGGCWSVGMAPAISQESNLGNNTQVKQMRWERAERAVIVQSLVSARCDSTACYVLIVSFSLFFSCPDTTLLFWFTLTAFMVSATAGSCLQWEGSISPLCIPAQHQTADRARQRLAGERSGAFSSWRLTYFPNELVEIKNRSLNEWQCCPAEYVNKQTCTRHKNNLFLLPIWP